MARNGTSGDSVVTPPMIVPAGGTWNDDATNAPGEPMRTRLTRDTEGLFTPQPWITILRNHADVASVEDPLATVTTGAGGGGRQALTVPPGAFIQKHHAGLQPNEATPTKALRPSRDFAPPWRARGRRL
jgi:DNA (cytosine-5)-methyltransferase 1